MWRRPRPVLRPKDPDREAKLAARRQLLSAMPDDETAVFMDEVEVHTNPKVGSRWMRRGGQAVVATPGTDERRVLAGSSHWRTGRVVLTPGRPKEGRTAALFCRHLDDLRRAFRHYRVVHVICDNARVHKPEHARRVNSFSSATVSIANPLCLKTKLAAAVSSRAARLLDFALQNSINPTAELRVLSPEAPAITPGPNKQLLSKVHSCLVSRAVTIYQIAQIAADFFDQKGLGFGISLPGMAHQFIDPAPLEVHVA